MLNSSGKCCKHVLQICSESPCTRFFFRVVSYRSKFNLKLVTIERSGIFKMEFVHFETEILNIVDERSISSSQVVS